MVPSHPRLKRRRGSWYHELNSIFTSKPASQQTDEANTDDTDRTVGTDTESVRIRVIREIHVQLLLCSLRERRKLITYYLLNFLEHFTNLYKAYRQNLRIL